MLQVEVLVFFIFDHSRIQLAPLKPRVVFIVPLFESAYGYLNLRPLSVEVSYSLALSSGPHWIVSGIVLHLRRLRHFFNGYCVFAIVLVHCSIYLNHFPCFFLGFHDF